MGASIRMSLLCLAATVLLGAGLAAAQTEVLLGEPPLAFVDEAPPWVDPEPRRAVGVDGWSRTAVASLFHTEYEPPLSVPMQWTGNVASCTAGTTSQAYIDATMQMINYYRGMVGLPAVTNAAGTNAGAQQAALIMSANGALSHNPPSSWTCWTSAGAAAAGASNLALGNAGPGAIVAYIRDSGSGNYFVGHRRWILYPRRNEFGTGSVGETTTSANALYVFTSTVARPATPARVAWPPEGYVPYQTVYPRWSLSLNTSSSVSFASATVTMSEGGSPVPLSVVSRTDNGYGDNTIVWEPSGISFTPGGPDRRFTVTVGNISVSGSPQTAVYDVVIIDPDVVTDLIFADGFNAGTTGAWSSTIP
ncbi:MAG: CAP domain-containing protein [Thermoanaerobaculales bacterium]|jgi:uncharacterized protein YkwD|nr:CAP domain-containing protein [Thermoanaerobaculales bacterium]